MKRKNNKRESKKITISAQVATKDVFHYPDKKIKTVFEIPNSSGELKQCILWRQEEEPKFKVGDTVLLEGYIKNKVFLVWTLRVIRRANGDTSVQN